LAHVADNWIAAGNVKDIPEGATLRVVVGGEAVCLYSLGNRVYATQDQCTHGQASLAEGFICDDNIECPLHQGLFHIPSGRAVGVPCTEDLRTYAVKVAEDGTVLVRANGPAAAPPK
jgi:naphthalene 1,2-dioxygenase ferredoxin component